MHRGFGKIHSRCDGGWHKSIQAVSERLELWGYAPEEAYRVASLTEEQYEATRARAYELLRALKGNRVNYKEALDLIMDLMVRLTEEQEKDLDEMADNFKKTKGGK